MTGERRCAAATLCRGYTVTDGKRVAAQLTTPTGLCQPCQRGIRRAMRELPADWCKLKLTIGESRAPIGGGGRRPKPGSRVPINTAADDLMRRIVYTAWDAALVVAFELNARWDWARASRSSGHDYKLLSAAVDLVAPNVDKLADVDPHAALRICLMHRYATKHLGETRQLERKHLPCPSCGAQALVKEVQDLRGRQSIDGIETPEVIRCLACDGGPNGDGTWTEDQYRWLAKMVTSEREEHKVLKWLLAEAQWERDIAAWLAAEREWALGVVAGILNIESGPGLTSAAGLLERVRGTAVAA